MTSTYNDKKPRAELPEYKTANTRQVGGSHYGAKYQHWDMVIEHDLNYFEGQITKYVMRARKKNGLQDLQKAAHFLEKYMEEWEQINRVPAVEIRAVYPERTLEAVDEEYERQLVASKSFQPDGFSGDGSNGYQCIHCRQVVKAKSPIGAVIAHACPGGRGTVL